MRRRRVRIKWRQVFLDQIFLSLGSSACILLGLATLLLFYIEGDVNPKIATYFDSLWWGVTTITTIGYGDIVPMTLAGRIIGICLMITGPAIFVLFTGALWRSVLEEQIALESPQNHDAHKIHTHVQELISLVKALNTRLDELERAEGKRSDRK